MAKRLQDEGGGRPASAKSAAFRLLAARRRTAAEVAARLRQKGFADVEVEETVRFLESYGMVDDRAYARDWVSERREKNGAARLRRELLAKGIHFEIVELALAGTDDESEYRAALNLAEKRLAGHGGICPLPRLARFLKSRGFSGAVIGRVCRTIGGPERFVLDSF